MITAIFNSGDSKKTRRYTKAGKRLVDMIRAHIQSGDKYKNDVIVYNENDYLTFNLDNIDSVDFELNRLKD